MPNLTTIKKSRLRMRIKHTPALAQLYAWLRSRASGFVLFGKFLNHLLFFSGSLAKEGRFLFRWKYLYPCLHDDTGATGFDRHYTFHTAWAARVVAQIKPGVHYDISSAIYFSTILSAFIPVRFYDYRPVTLRLSNLRSETADLLSLPFASDSISSLSCMHVVEHVGLGRYGDSLDPEGDRKAIRELQRVVSPGGHLLFVVPIGATPILMFNAHRIYSTPMILDYFQEAFHLKDFTLIPEDPADGDLAPSPSQDLLNKQFYGCGCFWFIKKKGNTA